MSTWTLPTALQLLHSQYPGAFVTSGARDPNSPLGRANPNSYHNIAQAFDIRPMPGVSFSSYVENLKDAGLPVVEALDEAKNPKPWTTGPNWHIAFSGSLPNQPETKQVATSPIDLLRRAQAFNVDIPPDPSMTPSTTPATPVQSAQAPGGFDLQKAIMDSLVAPSQAAAPKKKGSIWGSILGALSDGMLVMGGKDPMYTPAMETRRQDEADQNLSQQKLQEQMTEAKLSLLAKLQEQPAMLQDFDAFQKMSPEQQHAFLLYKDAVSPNTVATPQGTTNVPRTQTKTIGDKTYYNVGGTWYEEGQ
jgi:hypothetical protein